jgi:OHCU decarboxylase
MHTIDTLNSMPRETFAQALEPLFEAAAPLAEALYAARPYASYAALIDTAESLARAMPFDAQVAVLSAHPRIGADPATVSAASFREQGYAAEAEAGFDPSHLESIYTRLADLNAEYERQFGFRFVVFVNGRSKSEILEVLKERLTHTPEAELDTALRDMFQIARARLQQAPSASGTRAAAGARSIASTAVPDDDPARQSTLDELRRRAVEVYGEDRAGETTLHNALQAAATAVWRVTQEPLEPGANEP